MSLEAIIEKRRASLVLLHPTSLPDPAGASYGVGELGSEAYRFVDFLKEAGVLAWQVLPLGHTGFMDSPYQTFSRYAGSPYLVSVERLAAAGDLDATAHDAYVESVRRAGPAPAQADFGWLFEHKLGGGCDSGAVLRLAHRGFLARPASDPRREDFEAFRRQQGAENGGWLDDYSQYMAIKEHHGHAAWSEWPAPFRSVQSWRDQRASLRSRYPDLEGSVAFYQYVQFAFFEQWYALKEYANERGRIFIGDIPWYVGYDSADVWAHPEVFELDAEGVPVHVAGVPPDYFSKTGQLWGNPLYDWSSPGAFDWWLDAIVFLLSKVDVLRLDHFRAIDTYWKISWEWARQGGTAEEGCWGKGPAHELLKALQRKLMEKGQAGTTGQLPIIAEDLGFLDPLYAHPEDYPADWNPSQRFCVDPAFQKMLVDEQPSLQPALNPETGEYSARVGVDYLLEEYGLPWMGVIQFGLEGAERHHPDRLVPGCVIYTGTHDNNTAAGWYRTVMAQRLEEARLRGRTGEMPDVLGMPVPIAAGAGLPAGREVHWEMIGMALRSAAALAGMPLQDLLGLGSEARMNLPGDHRHNWWTWRAVGEQLDYPALAQRLRALNDQCARSV